MQLLEIFGKPGVKHKSSKKSQKSAYKSSVYRSKGSKKSSLMPIALKVDSKMVQTDLTADEVSKSRSHVDEDFKSGAEISSEGKVRSGNDRIRGSAHTGIGR